MSWPLAEESRRRVATPHVRRRTPRIMWAVVAAAFVCGAAVSAAAFSIGWKHQAQRGTTAESQLVAATATAHRLRTQLASVRTTLATARTHAAQVTASRHALARADATVRAELAAAKHSLAGVDASAASLGNDLDRLRNELHALTAYVSTTPSGQLDAGYVQAQLAYLAKTVDGFSAAVA
ncbi:MAG TPA: hypothetical protein VGH92_01690, partial [Gaiellaceae bacterium]